MWNNIEKPLIRLTLRKGRERRLWSINYETRIKRAIITQQHKELWQYCEHRSMPTILDRPEVMDQFLEQYHLPRLNHEVANLTRLITRPVLEIVTENFPKQKPRTRWLHRWILPNIQGVNTYASQALPKKKKSWKIENGSYLILWGQHHSHTKSTKWQYIQRKLQAIISHT